jgi:5-methylcytosine-specific restriction endonuclease McrA
MVSVSVIYKGWTPANPKPMQREGRKELSKRQLRLIGEELFEAQRGKCGRCGKEVPFVNFHVHHKRKRSLGRDDRRSNLEGICGGFADSCHSKEHA